MQCKFNCGPKENGTNFNGKKLGVSEQVLKQSKTLTNWFKTLTHNFSVVVGASDASYVESTSSASLLLPFLNAQQAKISIAQSTYTAQTVSVISIK